MTADRITNNSQTSGEIVAKLINRRNYYENVEKELTSQVKLVRDSLLKEKVFQERFAIYLLAEAIQVGDDNARKFAFRLIECVENGDSMDLFLEKNPDLNNLDLSSIFGKNGVFRELFKPVKKVCAPGLPIRLGLVERDEGRGSDNIHGDKRKTFKERVRLHLGTQVDTIEQVKALVPSVALLFEGETDAWVEINNTKAISLETLLEMFVRKKTSGIKNKDNIAVRHAIRYHDKGLLNRFLVTDIGKKYDNHDLFLWNGELFFSFNFCKDFFVFLTNNIFNSSRLLIEFNKDWKGNNLPNLDKDSTEVPDPLVDRPSTDECFESTQEVSDETVLSNKTEKEIVRDSEFSFWDPEQIRDFLDTDIGKKVYEVLINNSLIYAEYLIINQEKYPMVRAILENDLCWQKDYQNGDVRTHIDNLLNLIRFDFGNGRKLTDLEKSDFITNRLNPLWKQLLNKDNIGTGHSKFEGRNFLSKSEYMYAVYILDAIFENEYLNKEHLGLSKANNIKIIEMKEKGVALSVASC